MSATVKLKDCEQFFRSWQKLLEDEPAFYCLRLLTTDAFWRNRAWRKWRNIKHAVVSDWATARDFFFTPQDYLQVENHISLSIKTGKTKTLTVHAKSDGHKSFPLLMVIRIIHCRRCPRRCGLCVFRLQPLDAHASPPAR